MFIFAAEILTNITMKKILLFSIVAVAIVISSLLLINRKSTPVHASCDLYDNTYHYHLVCLGDESQCKFINPDGAEITCSGNKASAEPVIQ